MRGVHREAVRYGRYRVGGFSVQSPGFQVCQPTVTLGIYPIALLLDLQFSHLTGLIPGGLMCRSQEHQVMYTTEVAHNAGFFLLAHSCRGRQRSASR